MWTSAQRQRARIFDEDQGAYKSSGQWVQVSRLGNPLFNEVIVPMGRKDEWNADKPAGDAAYLADVQRPEVGGLLPVLYPGVFPNLAGYGKDRADLVAILLTGHPDRGRPGLPELHRPDVRRHAPAQRGGPAGEEAEQPRRGGR